MTLALQMADARYDGYEEGFDKGFIKGRKDGLHVGIRQGLQQGIEQGAYQNKLETARNLLSMGLCLEQVAQGTGLPLETVEQLAKE